MKQFSHVHRGKVFCYALSDSEQFRFVGLMNPELQVNLVARPDIR